MPFAMESGTSNPLLHSPPLSSPEQDHEKRLPAGSPACRAPSSSSNRQEPTNNSSSEPDRHFDVGSLARTADASINVIRAVSI